VDVQSAQVDPDTMRHYDPREDELQFNPSTVSAQVKDVLDRIERAERPVVFAGSGVRLGNALTEFERVIRLLRVPVVTAWTHDLIATDDELFCGRPGTIGERAGNFTVQNSDVLLVLGSRLNIRQTSYNWASFARFATKIQVDVDAAELRKPLHQPGRKIGESKDSGVTIPSMLKVGEAYGLPSFEIATVEDLEIVRRELDAPGPTLFDVQLDPAQEFEPRLRSKIAPDGKITTPNLEDMYPFLSPEELAENMLAKEEK
jgi:thiamine pyrophosphate-dependent acetolactate synthase large subunit-like protein